MTHWHSQILRDIGELRDLHDNDTPHVGGTITNQLTNDLREVAARMIQLAEEVEDAEGFEDEGYGLGDVRP